MSDVRVKVKMLPHAVQMPSQTHPGDSGFDVYAAVYDPVIIGATGRALIPTGIQVAVPTGYEIQVRPRSGLAVKDGITVLNSPGTIDAK